MHMGRNGTLFVLWDPTVSADSVPHLLLTGHMTLEKLVYDLSNDRARTI